MQSGRGAGEVDTSPFTFGTERVSLRRFYLAAALVVLNLLDVAFTKWILALGGTEGNPFMRDVIEHPTAPIVMKVGLCLAIGALLLACPPRSRFPEAAMFAVVIVYAVVVAWNSAILVQAVSYG